MINVEEVNKSVENTLNEVAENSLSGILPYTNFKFNIIADTGDYKEPEREERTNKVTRYINGICSILGNSQDGTKEATYNAVISTKIEFLIPLLNKRREDNKLLAEVRKCIADALNVVTEGEWTETREVTNEVTGEVTKNEQKYIRITEYSIAASGIREQRPMVGDSFSLLVYITHSFAAQGVSSDAIQLEIKYGIDGEYQRVLYSRYGLLRKTVTDGNTLSGAAGITKNLPISSVLTLNVDLIKRTYVVDKVINDYILTGEMKPISVKIILDDNVTKAKSKEFLMVIDTAGINAEPGVLSSSSLTLIEYLDIGGM